MIKKKISLMRRFNQMFILFIVAALALSGTLSYLNLDSFYHKEIKKNLRGATNYISTVLTADGDRFLQLMDYFKEHKDELHIALDFDGDFTPAKNDFERLWSERYPGQVPERTPVEKMDEETRRAYMLYLYEYFLYYIEQARGAMNLDYTYVVFPVEGKELTMCYFFDAFRDKNDAGELLLGVEVWEDPEMHAFMWEAWNSEDRTEGLDILDNEYGKNYAFSKPLVINDRTVAVVSAEVAVETVNTTIRSMTITQIALVGIALMMCSALVLMFIRSLVLWRIFRLEEHMASYSERKDPALADEVSREVDALRYSDELSALSGSFAALVRELDEYMRNLETVTAERERIGAELSVATNIQASMLPNIFPPFPERKEIDLFASMNPAKEVGGDFYDFFLVDDTHLAMVMADVSGKGVPAALFMVIAKTMIKNRALMGGTPAEVLADVNNQLCEGNEAELFVTVWMALLDITTGQGVAANAGHEHPIVKRVGGAFEPHIYRHSPPLGTMPGLPFRDHDFQLAPGDTLFMYTDGLTEAINQSNEQFGMDRILDALNREPDASLKTMLQTVKSDIERFTEGMPQFDDLTMLAVRLMKQEEPGEKA